MFFLNIKQVTFIFIHHIYKKMSSNLTYISNNNINCNINNYTDNNQITSYNRSWTSIPIVMP